MQDERGGVEGRQNWDELVIPPLVRAGEVDQIAANATRIAQMNVVFVSGNRAWGGSEELWSATAAVLASEGHRVTVFKSGVDDSEPRMRRLRALGCPIRDLARFPLTTKSLFSLIRRLSSNAAYVHEAIRLFFGLAFSRRPDLIVLSQGGNHDGVVFAEVCRRLRLPYAIVSQKASELYWPEDWQQKTI